MAKRIVLSGDKSGGHLYFLRTMVRQIRTTYGKEEDIDFLFLGPDSELVEKVISGESIQRTSISYANSFLGIFSFLWGVIQSLFALFVFMPDVVLAKSGYASIPVVVAAKIFRIPVLIHVSNANPSFASKVLGSLANRVVLVFSRAALFFPSSRTVVVGNPVRKEAIGGSVDVARELLNMKKAVKPVVMFYGGTEGSNVMNRQVIFMIEQLLEKYQVIHQTGHTQYQTVVAQAQKRGFKIGRSDYYPLEYIDDDLKHYLALSDVIISKSGSLSISEIAANSKPSILVPIFKELNQNQRINAYELAKSGAAVVLGEDNFKKSLILHNIESLIYDVRLRKRTIESISKFYNPKAAGQIADNLMKLID